MIYPIYIGTFNRSLPPAASEIEDSGCFIDDQEPDDWAGLYCGANTTIYYRTDWSPSEPIHYLDVITHEFAHHLQHRIARRDVQQQENDEGDEVEFEVTEQARRSIASWIERKKLASDDWLFPSRQWPGRHLSTRQYSRLVKWWVELIGLQPSGYGTHSLRRTKVCLLYKKTGNLRACQLLLGHTKLESTVRYLGIEVDDALAIAEQVGV